MYSFSILNQSIVPCPVLTVASWQAYRFLRSQVRWYGTHHSLIIFPKKKKEEEFSSLLWSTQRLYMVKEAEGDVLLELPCFLRDPTSVRNLITGSSASLKPSLYIWKFSLHVLLKPGLKDFEHSLASMWDESNCTVVWTFFCTILLWVWNENWPFLVLWPLLSFPILLACWVQHFHSIIFGILNSSAGISSPPITLFIVMLPEAYLASHSRMS